MDIKLIIIIAFSYLYAIFEIFMSVMQRSKRAKEVVIKGDKASIWILMFSIALGYCLSFTVGATKMGRVYHWNTFFAIGALMVIVGLFIRIRSIMILKQHFTYIVTKIEGHELIETGFYKIISILGIWGN
jgi:protein-S-isoprenylcysteine O-methyltransferase Ste14